VEVKHRLTVNAKHVKLCFLLHAGVFCFFLLNIARTKWYCGWARATQHVAESRHSSSGEVKCIFNLGQHFGRIQLPTFIRAKQLVITSDLLGRVTQRDTEDKGNRATRIDKLLNTQASRHWAKAYRRSRNARKPCKN